MAWVFASHICWINPMLTVEAKWRPTLPMITAGMIGLVIVFAIGGFAIVRFNVEQPATKEVATAALLALLVATVLGAVFVRAISRPLRELRARASAISAGDRGAIGPLTHHGTRELAAVTQSFMDMAQSLFAQSDYLRTFQRHVSHELKTPLTSMRGAAELMLDNAAMPEPERERFLRIVAADVERMLVLLERLSELSGAEAADLTGETTLDEALTAIRSRFPDLSVVIQDEAQARIAISADNAGIVFAHLLDNALRHGATRIEISTQMTHQLLRVTVWDDGTGISTGNRDRIFDPFFTTRRAEGGTGMGLAIVRTLLSVHGGAIRFVESETGTAFELQFKLRQTQAGHHSPANNLHEIS
jgi:signal transduction histidine kinase